MIHMGKMHYQMCGWIKVSDRAVYLHVLCDMMYGAVNVRITRFNVCIKSIVQAARVTFHGF